MTPSHQPHEGSILRTKFHRPQVSADLVIRKRLHEQMDRGLRSTTTLVSAPAGYGKSMLASQWAESLEEPCAWLSLDSGDSDPTVFVSYLVAAIRELFPDACPKSGTFIAAPSLPPMSELGRILANELENIETPFVLALDDYHRISPSSGVHELLEQVLEYPPESLRLVILTRRDPPLRLASMRAKDRLTEVRLQDLRFTETECAAFLENTTGLAVKEESLSNLLLQTEGWGVGLRLVSLQLRHLDDPDRFLRELRGGVQHGRDYLLKEVLAQRSPRIRSWMLQTSILNRFCPDLCDALCMDDDTFEGAELNGRQFVDELQRCNLFTISLDTRGEWFRYHHLFREFLLDLLQQERPPEEVAALHGRASKWFAGQGLIDGAIRHALDGGDPQSAIRLVEEHRYELINTEDWNRLERWLGLLPHDSVTANPMLVSAQAYLHDFRGQVAEEFAYRDRAETLLSTLPPGAPNREAVEGEIATLHAVQAFLSGGGPRTLEFAERAVALLPPEAVQIRSLAVGFRALAHQVMGDLARALEVIGETVADLSPGRELLQVRLMLYLCLIHMMDGSPDDVAKTARRCIDRQERLGLTSLMGAARYFLGVSHYLRNDLPEAERELAGMLEHRYSTRTFMLVSGAVALACVYLAHGRTAEASRVVELVLTQMTERGDSLGAGTCRAFEVDLMIRQGRIAEARRLSRVAEFEPFPPIYFFYVPQLTPVKLLLAEKRPDGLRKAGETLDELEAFLRGTHRTTILIDVLSLQALVLDAQGEEPAALGKLGEALALAEPGGIIRSFIDLGPPMADLLHRLVRHTDTTDFISEILEAFTAEQISAAEEQSDAVNGQAASRGLRPSLEILTNREQEVLELLARRLQNKEIAAELFISTQTVNSHLKSIYQKLDVKNRRQAAARAVEMGILQPR